MSYDDWRATEPDEPWERETPCATKDCDGSVCFPDIEQFCNTCLVDQEQKARALAEQSTLQDVQVRR